MQTFRTRAESKLLQSPIAVQITLKTLLSLEVAVTYLRAGHLLDPGRYRLTLEVAAANVPPQTFEVEVRHSGDWHDDEDAMRASGLILGPVRRVPASAGERPTVPRLSP